MSCKIRCYTLFDITKTGITNRKNVSINAVDPMHWQRARNQQCNFDTILQLISLRSQPEDITDPKLLKIQFKEFDKFGFLFENETSDDTYNCWSFDFSISHQSVFDDGISELGCLYVDCDSVPMILIGTEWNKLPAFLDTSIELRNIYFEVISNE
jgi:hypothetical protein